jgi:hypothetical protein
MIDRAGVLWDLGLYNACSRAAPFSPSSRRGLRSAPPFVCGTRDTHPGPRPACFVRGRKMGSAASPSRYSGRPEAGHDSRDRSPYRVVNKHPFGYALGPSSVVQSAQSQAGRPLVPPQRRGGPAFLLSVGDPGPIGPAGGGLSRRRELRLNGVLRSSSHGTLPVTCK